ncbi:carbohydrate diacid regulon transcriptional regulator CdaR [Erwinia sp. OLTSP20]|uniref:CdaR family transcriptional regulator n=1 Tax=unclassified Erwinia TaxID=2622719 RepID=UPI000C17FA1B|nr:MULTISPECIES: CdaR family transcriptional regulator [unclassified Erwinia]PIJ49872.1 carbohydrate diacid regulon transcriptional regulator CdaR [Erwinia sp. OAMSP11]PIJ70970.1 carbohydrate diacid regulon transcriptional regulator CdaR [Erwinia sp. OLSSP12]PIJ80336.1 carbohydrate diacid regulon transcriptional regulator CdaR [Erwinia sp. OLCASP19]PIJ82459.1 carbohydrate diacid regulon transcriptional regulator CdaR [Erwinia sp. OLMTSP26]PIJ85146.1 carbohydrate diacid regulon transcriptional 
MASDHLDARLAQDIVARTMQIIDSNVNVMDARGRIICSGDSERIGELHEGALLALSQGRVVDIDEAVVRHLHGVRPGINLPMRLDGDIVGVIGLTGDPARLRHYGELVCMTAEMMLEQARLLHMLAQDSRLREELVLNLIRSEILSPTLTEWAQRLGIDLQQPRVAAVVEVDSGQLGVDSAMAELQQLQTLLTTPDRDNLIAIVSLTEVVVLKPALNAHGRYDIDDHRRRVDALMTRMKARGNLRIRIALGNFFTGPGSIARSYRTAHTTMLVGKQRMPEQRSYFYQDLMLPVLLDSLRGGWQANELARPLARLRAMDNNGLLRRTLLAWFQHNVQPSATAKALYIHRNTLEYRLNRVSELTGLNLSHFDDRLLLYIALQLDEQP